MIYEMLTLSIIEMDLILSLKAVDVSRGRRSIMTFDNQTFCCQNLKLTIDNQTFCCQQYQN